jgi:hypothetical protein
MFRWVRAAFWQPDFRLSPLGRSGTDVDHQGVGKPHLLQGWAEGSLVECGNFALRGVERMQGQRGVHSSHPK